MRRLGFFDRRIRGFRIVELGAMAVLVALVLVVYLAKDGAGDKRADIDRVQEQILAEQDQIRLLRAEVAHQEQPERLSALAGQYLGLQPITAKHEVETSDLADVARVVATAPAKPAAASGQAAVAPTSAAPGAVVPAPASATPAPPPAVSAH
jgi:cell division protein FtsL